MTSISHKLRTILENKFNIVLKKSYPRAFNKYVYSQIDHNYRVTPGMPAWRRKKEELNHLTGVEIGVDLGRNAEQILNILPVEKLYLVDPYPGGHQCFNESDYDSGTAREKAGKRLEKYSERIEWVEETSNEAVNMIPDDLDFVYIDGDHSYSQVLKDIQNYYPKLNEGGVIGGHDANRESVFTAVYDFCQKHSEDLVPVILFNEGFPDWTIKSRENLEINTKKTGKGDRSET